MKKVIAIVLLAAVAAEAAGVPVLDTVVTWTETTVIDPVIEWLSSQVTV